MLTRKPRWLAAGPAVLLAASPLLPLPAHAVTPQPAAPADGAANMTVVVPRALLGQPQDLPLTLAPGDSATFTVPLWVAGNEPAPRLSVSARGARLTCDPDGPVRAGAVTTLTCTVTMNRSASDARDCELVILVKTHGRPTRLSLPAPTAV